MTHSPAIKRLGQALRSITDNGDPGKVVALAREFGIEGRLARRAAKDIPVNADAYLKLCDAIGIDPVTGDPAERQRIGDLDWGLLGLGLRLTRRLKGHKGNIAILEIRDIARSTLSRVENGGSISVDHMLAICKYIGTHPFGYCGKFHGKQSPEMQGAVTKKEKVPA